MKLAIINKFKSKCLTDNEAKSKIFDKYSKKLKSIDSFTLLFFYLKNQESINSSPLYRTVYEIIKNEYPNVFLVTNNNKVCLIFLNKNKYQAKQLVKEIKERIITIKKVKKIVAKSESTIESLNYPEDINSVDIILELAEYRLKDTSNNKN